MLTDARPRGPRVYLRSLTKSDATDSYLRWINDPEVTAQLTGGANPPSIAELEQYIEANLAAPTTYFFAIVVSSNGQHIGNIKLADISSTHQRAEIGVMIGEKAMWGMGYASEAIGVLSDWAFKEIGLHKLTAGVNATNPASIRAFERADFHVEAVRKNHTRVGDQFIDGILMARFRD